MKEHYVLPPNLNKRLISTLMSNRSPDPNENKSFSLKSSSAFASRSVDVFAGLQNLEKKHETWMSENKTIEYQDETDDKLPSTERKNKIGESKSQIVNPHRSKGSSDAIFKKPFPSRPLKRSNSSIPNFKRKHQKWTKYSLEDIPLSSDSTNTAVALQFMDELRKRRESATEEADCSERILFNKPMLKGHKTKVRSEKLLSANKDKTLNCNVKLFHLEEEDSD